MKLIACGLARSFSDYKKTESRGGSRAGCPAALRPEPARLGLFIVGKGVEAGGPYIRHFIPQVPAISPRRTPFPKNNKELTLAAAWKFSDQGKRALIFCTQRDYVEGYANAVIDLHRRGFLPSLLNDVAPIQRAIAVGKEWLGSDHPAVHCLPIGVAIHHGRLPGSFLREVEALLAAGVLRVTIASPTLAQGLNLNAAVLLIPMLYRAGVPLLGRSLPM